MSDKNDANPILDILNEILKPKTTTATASGINTDEILEGATQLRAVFEIFVKAGFTESQALELVGRMLKI